jgi:hypothetical protein
VKFSIKSLFALTALVSAVAAAGAHLSRTLGIGAFIVFAIFVFHSILLATIITIDRKCIRGAGIGVLVVGLLVLWVHPGPDWPLDLAGIATFGMVGGILGGAVHLAIRGHNDWAWPLLALWIELCFFFSLPAVH